MSRISKIDLDKASDEVRQAVACHLAQGYRITNEKLTLLHNVTAFRALEVQSYAVDRVLARMIGKRAADLFEYAISAENDCLVCSTYFVKLLRQYGIDEPGAASLTEKEELLMRFGRAIAVDPKGVDDCLFSALRDSFTEEEIVVITTMGVLIMANNAFNDMKDSWQRSIRRLRN